MVFSSLKVTQLVVNNVVMLKNNTRPHSRLFHLHPQTIMSIDRPPVPTSAGPEVQRVRPTREPVPPRPPCVPPLPDPKVHTSVTRYTRAAAVPVRKRSGCAPPKALRVRPPEGPASPSARKRSGCARPKLQQQPQTRTLNTIFRTIPAPPSAARHGA